MLASAKSELRPKDFNLFTLLKASMNFFREGMKENLRGMVNDLDLEHLLPHQLNDDIIKNFDKLKDKYSEQVPEDDSSLDGAKRIANKIIIGEVEKFKSEAAEKARKVNPIEVQVDAILQNLSALPREKKCCIAYSRISSQYKGDERAIMENILLKKLEITKKEMNKMLEENDISKLKLALDDACKKSGKSIEEMIKEVEEVVSSRFSHEVSVSNIATESARL
ncbi:unnamed protein product [Parnassius apollo]|uniref:(apollo) hypothetical protein n=1 Tax=Parnassius apollo TaxID=110799 RepID=A0A8S3Y6W3_PARAO|nr:unnamed protein product [Parnassius apollo]